MPGGTGGGFGAAGGVLQIIGGIHMLIGSDRTAALAKEELRAASEQAGIEIANSIAVAELQQLNASRAEVDAAVQLHVAEAQARDIRKAGRREAGTINALAGVSGVETQGSVFDALLESGFQHERAARLGLAAAHRTYLNLRDEAADLRTASIQARRTGRQQATATLRTGKARADARLAQASKEAVQGAATIGEGGMSIAGGVA